MGRYKKNERAPQMFRAISFEIYFEGATVVDIGCGYGDLALMAAYAGADTVQAYDNNPEVVAHTAAKFQDRMPVGVRYGVYLFDANSPDDWASLPQCDVVFCTSVLPYLEDRDEVLRNLANLSGSAVVEMQYFGDGPGPRDIRNDADMRQLLERHWSVVRRIGQTFTGRTPPHRAIWLCRNEAS